MRWNGRRQGVTMGRFLDSALRASLEMTKNAPLEIKGGMVSLEITGALRNDKADASTRDA